MVKHDDVAHSYLKDRAVGGEPYVGIELLTGEHGAAKSAAHRFESVDIVSADGAQQCTPRNAERAQAMEDWHRKSRSSSDGGIRVKRVTVAAESVEEREILPRKEADFVVWLSLRSFPNGGVAPLSTEASGSADNDGGACRRQSLAGLGADQFRLNSGVRIFALVKEGHDSLCDPHLPGGRQWAIELYELLAVQYG